MEGISIVIPVHNRLEMTKRCIEFILEMNRDYTYEIIVIDNGSTDGTQKYFFNVTTIIYHRNKSNLGISKALNQGAHLARNAILCFMHNDVLVHERDWIKKVSGFISKNERIGIAGFYGAKKIRKDGTFRGKTIIHSKKDSPVIKKEFEQVTVVDGLCMCIKRDIFENIGEFDEIFTFHFYDKDISMKCLKAGYKNYVLNIPFEHFCGLTRKVIKGEDRVREEAKRVFINKWKGILPVDVSTIKERFSFLVKGIF
jgi:GT2 family glycosyltransferase